MANIYNNLALIYQEEKNFSKAKKLFLRALEIEKEMGNLEGIINISSNLELLIKEIREK